MSRVFTRRLAGVVASVVAFAIIAPSTFLSVKADNNDKVQLGSFTYATSDSLGAANAFAVFAKNYSCENSDMEGLIAADSTVFGGQDVGASDSVKQYIFEGYNFNYFGSEISGEITQIRKADALILPDNVTITTGEGAPNNGNGVRLTYKNYVKEFNSVDNLIYSADASKITNVKNSTFTIDFDQAFNCLKTYSLYAYDQETVYASYDGDVIKIICQQGLNYVSLDVGDVASKNICIEGAEIDGAKITDYSLIINIKNANGDVSLDHDMTIDGNGYSAYGEIGGKILWNFGPDYSGEVTFVKDSMGVVLAPSGTVKLGQTHNGSIFAANVSNNGSEIHQNPFQGSKLNPNPTPTEEPTPTETEPTETMPAETTPAETTPAETTPAETTPAETTPAETTPAETTPAETTPAETTPAETTPAETTPAETTPADTTPAETTPVETTPAETTPAETTPAETTPAETTPAETTPAETTPAETTPAETTPAETTPAETTPAETTPAETTPTEPTPATTTLTISKQAMTGTTGAELADAQMKLTANTNSGLRYLKVTGGKTGAVVTQTAKTISWTSGDAPFVIEELPDGTYTLEEIVAPNGYDVITTTQFTVSGGVVTKTTSNTDVTVSASSTGVYITAFDEAITTTTTTFPGVEISKQDIAGNEIADATLTITSLDGFDLSNVYVTQNGVNISLVLSDDKQSISFKTVDSMNSIVFGLAAGKYELKETVTPAQFLRADAIVFEISNNGNVINTATNVQGSPIVMIDEADPTYSTSGTTTSVAFSKQAMTNLGTELLGATMKITTSNLSIDLSGVNYTGGESVVRTTSMITWTTTDTVFEVDLPDGTYVLEEVIAPDGFNVITTTTFTVSGGVVTKTSSNTDVDITGTYVTAFDEAKADASTLVAGASRIPPTTVENLNAEVQKATLVAGAKKVPATGESMAVSDIAAIVLLVAAAATIGTVAVKTKKETH